VGEAYNGIGGFDSLGYFNFTNSLNIAFLIFERKKKKEEEAEAVFQLRCWTDLKRYTSHHPRWCP